MKRGQRIGVMGHTGEGIDRERAHVHLELNLMLAPTSNRGMTFISTTIRIATGIYNGLNLVGIDVARLYLALRKNPHSPFPNSSARKRPSRVQSDRAQREAFRSRETIPMAVAEFRFVRAKVLGDFFRTIRCSSKGRAECANGNWTGANLFQRSSGNYSQLTRNALTGHGDRAALSESGKRLMQLLVFPDRTSIGGENVLCC